MKTYKIGLIGFGFIGKIHAKAYNSINFCFKNPGVNANVISILRSNPDLDQQLISSIGKPMVTADVDEFFSKDFDILDICSPNDSHFDYAMKAIEKEIPIYCEKPITDRIENARSLTHEVNRRKIPSHTAFVFRYFPAIQQAKQIITAGKLGEIFHFRFKIYHGGYNNAERPISWRLLDKFSGGGAFADLGIHLIDLTHFLLGEIEWVQSQTRTFIQERPLSIGSSERIEVDVDDWSLCVVGLSNNTIGNLETTRVSGGIDSKSSLEIFGSKGTLMIDFENVQSANFFDLSKNQWSEGLPLDMKSSQQIIWPERKKSLGYAVDAHTTCILDFLKILDDKKNSDLNFNNALKAQKVLHAAYQSASKDGEKIHISNLFSE